MQITTIGLDIAKNVFQVHGIDANEKVVVRKQLLSGPKPSRNHAAHPHGARAAARADAAQSACLCRTVKTIRWEVLVSRRCCRSWSYWA
jgi:hypothetical protein